MTTRPTELALLLKHCPGAVALYRQGAPQDRSIFHTGTAAHEVLEGMASGIGTEATIRRLVTEGRKGQDAEPPLPADAVLAGADLARRWVEEHGTPQGTPELRLSLDDVVATRIDLVWTEAVEGPESDLTVAVARDYKSSWQADDDELDTTQRRIHAVLLWHHYPEADGVRVEVANLRTRRIHERTFWRGVDDDTLSAWESDVRAVAATLDGPLTFAPGTRCLGCSYAGHCPEAWALARDPDADPVRRWAAADAAAKALKPMAMAATKEAPRVVDGLVVGYSERASRTTTDETPAALLDVWEAAHGGGYDRPTVSALLTALGLGVGQVTALGEALWKGRGSREPREALERAALADKVGRSWGVTAE